MTVFDTKYMNWQLVMLYWWCFSDKHKITTPTAKHTNVTADTFKMLV